MSSFHHVIARSSHWPITKHFTLDLHTNLNRVLGTGHEACPLWRLSRVCPVFFSYATGGNKCSGDTDRMNCECMRITPMPSFSLSPLFHFPMTGLHLQINCFFDQLYRSWKIPKVEGACSYIEQTPWNFRLLCHVWNLPKKIKNSKIQKFNNWKEKY